MRYTHFSMLPDKAFKPTGFGSSARMTLEGGLVNYSPEMAARLQEMMHPGQSKQAAADWVKMMQGGQQTQQPYQPQYQPQPYVPQAAPTQPQPWWMQQGAGATANAAQNYMQQIQAQQQQPQAGLGALVPQPPYK